MTNIHIIKNKLTCTLTGKIVSVAPKVFDQRALKYGSIDNLKSNYISKLGRELLREGKTSAEIRHMFNVTDIPAPAEVYIQKHTRWIKYRKPKILSNNDNTN